MGQMTPTSVIFHPHGSQAQSRRFRLQMVQPGKGRSYTAITIYCRLNLHGLWHSDALQKRIDNPIRRFSASLRLET